MGDQGKGEFSAALVVSKMRELVVAGIAVDQESGGPVLLLRDPKEEEHFVPLRIGEAEAVAILIGLEGSVPPRPLTHDLLHSVLEALEAALEEVVLNRLEEGICYASLHIRKSNGELVQVDARPSDSVALAIRTGSPIYIEEAVYEELVQELPEF